MNSLDTAWREILKGYEFDQNTGRNGEIAMNIALTALKSALKEYCKECKNANRSLQKSCHRQNERSK